MVLADRGVFGSVFCPPATAEGRSYLRFTVNAGVTEAQITRFLEVMEAARPILAPSTTTALQSLPTIRPATTCRPH